MYMCVCIYVSMCVYIHVYMYINAYTSHPSSTEPPAPARKTKETALPTVLTARMRSPAPTHKSKPTAPPKIPICARGRTRGCNRGVTSTPRRVTQFLCARPRQRPTPDRLADRWERESE